MAADLHSTKVLITGGSGLVGRYLTSLLLSEGYTVAHLSRKHNQFGRVRVHRWDPEKGILDPVVLEGTDVIVHLAGKNIGRGRWTTERKKEIMESRVCSALLLHNTISRNRIPLKAFISASGAGFYGQATTEAIFTETDPPGQGFLAEVCRRWEDAAGNFEGSGIRTVKIRSAVVLEKNDAAMKRLMMSSKAGFLVRIGKGEQYMPWIHVSDLCRIYLKAISDREMSGTYNAVSPEHVMHREFMATLAVVTGKYLLPFNIPPLMLKLAYGEMSGVVLGGSRISPEKIISAGFRFEHGNLNEALADLLKQ
ncbi:MAG: TIGR01777 family oxidoreductase [Bacteroidales bacterium]|nr:TIGR01777 family oxidoreductase [Bacteroidales bacterium]